MLSYIFAIRGFFLPLEGLLLAFFIGALLAYFSNRSLKTLYRIPYLFMFSLIFLVYIFMSYTVNVALLNINGTVAPTVIRLIAAIPPFLFGYAAMYLSVLRARDGFANKFSAWLLIVPLFNLGLFIVTLDDDPNDNEKAIQRDPLSTPRFMNGAAGVIVATIIFALSFTFGMMSVTYPTVDVVLQTVDLPLD
ncbi:hypothetical protein [uncultured Bartonella sp.]|uniref:hypothetical protein n=1 Tax=uncultured Bartonella sp. TaxID=104108 RepID=UPI0026058849|nr:hypothetical protein [uncultured Bartonella sp.]